MSQPDQPNTSPEQLLAEIIAGHFIDARVEDRSGNETVVLGDALPTIECHIHSIEDGPPYGAYITLIIQGGALGVQGATVTASGYGETIHDALVVAGCNWACAFGPVLLTSIGRPDLINTQDPDVEQFEADIAGRRYLVTMSGLDRGGNVTVDEVSAYRTRLGGSRALTEAVLSSETLPASRSGDVIPLGVFLGVGPKNLSEVKYGLGDWAPARAVWDHLPTESDGYRLLREWALLAPISPPPPLTHQSLQHTLDQLRAAADSPQSEGGWRGGLHHGMRLGAPATPEQLAAWGPLPPDARWFLEEIAASGAGPGYGLDLRLIEPGWLHLAAAGCGASWVLGLSDGQVWLDSRACDGQVQPVAPNFAAWYEAWLDNAIRGGGPFARWDYQADAAVKILVQAAEQYGGVENLPEADFQVAINGPDGAPTGPCHACEALYDHYGVPSTVFTTGPQRPE
ncbi:MAG: SMI1/KNR4 family protein [Propionibacteriaceae bacterium]|nr:SMI1/KNR4 family protein [Propionibacteriaceae bacterium]